MLDSKKCWTGLEDYATPSWLKEGVFGGWFDPCPLHGILDGKKIDGLTIKWSGKRVFINPPYSRVMPWVERAIVAARSGKTVVMLLKHDSSTKWFARLHEAGAVFLTFVGRISFNGLDLAPFPSVLVILSRELCSSEVRVSNPASEKRSKNKMEEKIKVEHPCSGKKRPLVQRRRSDRIRQEHQCQSHRRFDKRIFH